MGTVLVALTALIFLVRGPENRGLGYVGLLLVLVVANSAEWGTTGTLFALGCSFLILYNDKIFTGTNGAPSKLAKVSVPISLEALRVGQANLKKGQKVLRQLIFFDASTPAFEKAWETRNLDTIEAQLAAGDKLNRASWSTAFECYNSATKIIDTSRAGLFETIETARPVLKRLGVSVDVQTADRSTQAAGYAPAIDLKQKLTARLDLNAGTANAVGRVATGNVPWQVAAVAVAGAWLVKQIGKSEMLRKYKEAESALSGQSSELRADAQMIDTLISTRLIPHMDVIIASISEIRAGVAKAGVPGSDASGVTEEDIARLSIAVAEGQRALNMAAGD